MTKPETARQDDDMLLINENQAILCSWRPNDVTKSLKIVTKSGIVSCEGEVPPAPTSQLRG